MRRFFVAVALIFFGQGAWAQADSQCVIGSLTEVTPPWSIQPASLLLDVSSTLDGEGNATQLTEMVSDAWGMWKNAQCSTLPAVATWDGTGERPTAGERWTFKMGTYEQLGVKGTPAETMKVCGQADLNTHTILLFTGDQVSDLCRIRFENLSDDERNRQSWVQTLAHELGHTFRLADAEDSSACRNPNGPGSIMGGAYGARKVVTTDDCNALEKEVRRFCEQNPNDDGCDDGELECVPAAYLRVGGDGKDPVVITAASASSRSYRVRLDHAGKLGVKLTGMNRDFDCKLYESAPPPSSDAPDAVTGSTSTWSCTNRGGAREDSLERKLPAGTHTLSVYPFTGGTGDYTLSLSYAADPLPSPIARILPFTSEVTTSSSSTFRFTLAESAKVSVLISEMTADFDCRVGPKSECSNNRGTLDDTWSGTLGPATHSLTVFPHNGASGLFKLAVYRTGETPPSHDSDADEDGEGDEAEEDGDDEDGGDGEDEDTDTGDGEEDDGDTGGGDEEDGGTEDDEDEDGDDGEEEDDDEPAPTPEPDPPPPPAVSPPGVPTVTGSVARQTQTVTWTEPATNGGAITRYQMAVRNSASHPWRWTTAGTPSGSSNFGPTVRSWSVTTPAGLLRHYRDDGDDDGDGRTDGCSDPSDPTVDSNLPPC